MPTDRAHVTLVTDRLRRVENVVRDLAWAYRGHYYGADDSPLLVTTLTRADRAATDLQTIVDEIRLLTT